VKILVTGSAGHLGEALARTLQGEHEVVGLDLRASPYTTVVGSITDRAAVERAAHKVEAVIHAATLHKPHIVTHTRHDFVSTNIVGTLTLLEAAVAAGAGTFLYTSTTSVYGRALAPETGSPAAWIDEDVAPLPRNIYGVTKKSAEDLCELFHRKFGLACIVLRTSRFFPDEDDDEAIRAAYADDNVKVNELLYRRLDVEDAVAAHRLALEHAQALGFRRYVISATTPFERAHVPLLRTDAPRLVRELFPAYEREYASRGWAMFPSIDRVYVNERARRELGWEPRWTFAFLLEQLAARGDLRSPLARSIGFKGYHDAALPGGRYPTE
jgi:nucleoside-diphosphate-sugar epimerase